MPKKTKKQKLRARTHRQAYAPVVHSITSSPLERPAVHTPPSYVFAAAHTKVTTLIHDERALKGDIIKTVVLVTIILGIELLLSRYLS